MHGALPQVTSRWLLCPSPRPRATQRLFCFPYAGGGTALYRPWAQQLPAHLELWLIQLPGREARMRDPLYTRLSTLADDIADALAPYTDRPYALFGHSMGALAAFETARALRRREALLPMHLFVSGRRAPHLADPDPHLHPLADDLFVHEIVRRYNGIPQVVREDAELLQLFLPMLRADIEMIETYVYRPEPALDCPITVFGGSSDPRASRTELVAWMAHTTGSFLVRQFPGDHFYLQQERAALLAELTLSLAQEF